ncbi:hypothetical protein FQN51_001922 [Onygenales sp. PD_10]|nr:hypothetical protein FQN51_001922 [Onygenales sp. PD_10]
MALSQAAVAIAMALLHSQVSFGYPNLFNNLQERRIEAVDSKKAYNHATVGGGQGGLVIANRLTEGKSNTVLVVEYGYLDNDPDRHSPFRRLCPPQDPYNLTSVPQEAADGKIFSVYHAAVIGSGFVMSGVLLIADQLRTI